jgi:hypothetical protein
VFKVEFHTASLFSALRVNITDQATLRALEVEFNQPVKPLADNQVLNKEQQQQQQKRKRVK